MARKLTGAQWKELRQLRRWCAMFVEFLVARGMDHAQAAGFFQVIDETAARPDLTGMRQIAGDFREWLRHFPAPLQAEFAGRVRAEAGVDLGAERQRELDRIETLLGRGTLTGADDYALVLERVEEIHADPARAPEVERLNRLLNTYPA
jgi:hypothetical protein